MTPVGHHVQGFAVRTTNTVRKAKVDEPVLGGDGIGEPVVRPMSDRLFSQLLDSWLAPSAPARRLSLHRLSSPYCMA